MDPDSRKNAAQRVNLAKDAITNAIQQRKQQLQEQQLTRRLEQEWLDVTTPGRKPIVGALHPITHTIDTMRQIFARLGFEHVDGPSIETDWYNFSALNIEENHPARQSCDTFYLKSGNLLRTHTSPVQIRHMETHKPPMRIISSGRVYRSDSDQTHTPMFHQMEGMVVEQGINFSHLKHTIITFIKLFFEDEDIAIRFRPSFFPFTEPSAEVDIKHNGRWLEVLGCGMVHPNVFANCKLNPEQTTGFAFGLGVERFAMIKHDIPDLRDMYLCDVRWQKHYGNIYT